MLQDFGSIHALAVLNRLGPILVTRAVANEQQRTAPPHSRRQFHNGIREGWITIHPPAPKRAVESEMARYFGLSRADCELLVTCERAQLILFTDDNALRRARRTHRTRLARRARPPLRAARTGGPASSPGIDGATRDAHPPAR